MDTSSLVIPSAAISYLSAQSIVISNTLVIGGQLIVSHGTLYLDPIIANTGIFNYLSANSHTLPMSTANINLIHSNIAQVYTITTNITSISTLTTSIANIEWLTANTLLGLQPVENLTVLNTLTANIIQSDVLSYQANSVIYSVGNLDISAHQVLRGNANLIVFHANTISIVGNLVQSNGNIVVFSPSDNIQLNSHVIIRGNLYQVFGNSLFGDTTLGNVRVLGNLILGANNLPGPRFSMPSPRIISTQGSQAVGLAELVGGVLDSTSAQTYPTAATLMVRGPCIVGANSTITDSLAFSVTGNSKLVGNLTVTNRVIVQQTPINPLGSGIANHTPAIAFVNGTSGWASDAFGNVVGLVKGNTILSLIRNTPTNDGHGIVIERGIQVSGVPISGGHPTLYFRPFADNVIPNTYIWLFTSGSTIFQIRNLTTDGNINVECGSDGMVSFAGGAPATAIFMVLMGNIQLVGNTTSLFGHIITLRGNSLTLVGNTTIAANLSVTNLVSCDNLIVSRELSANIISASNSITFTNHPYSGFQSDTYGNLNILVNGNIMMSAVESGLIIEQGNIYFMDDTLNTINTAIEYDDTTLHIRNGGNINMSAGGAITFTGNAALFRVNMGNIRMEGNTTTLLGNVDISDNLTVQGNLFIQSSVIGDMLYYNAGAGYQRLANGEANSMMTVNLSGLPTWNSSYVGQWGNVGNIVLVNTANAMISDVGMSLLFRNSGNLVSTNMDGNSMVTYTGGQTKVFTVQVSCSASMTGAVAIQVWIMLRKNLNIVLNASSGLAIGTTGSSYPMKINTIVSMAPGDNLTAHVFTTSGGAADITLSGLSLLMTSV